MRAYTTISKVQRDSDRIKEVYGKFEEAEIAYKYETYTYFRPMVYYFGIEIFENLIRALKANQILNYNLKDKKILEIGCAWGYRIKYFLELGADPKNLYGIDLLPYYLEKAKYLSPNTIKYICGDAQNLPFSDETFDIVSQFITFSAILDGDLQSKVASEMLRVLKSDGLIIWVDSRREGIKEKMDGIPYFEGIGKSTIEILFPNCSIEYKSIYLKPFVWKILLNSHVGIIQSVLKKLFFSKQAKEQPTAENFIKRESEQTINRVLLRIFRGLPFLKSHYFCIIRKKTK
jgi:SAM-dependent methyltransferase